MWMCRHAADSGADFNNMDEHQFKAFVHRSSVKPVLQPSNVKLYALQLSLDVKGDFQATIRNDTPGTLVTFVVALDIIKSHPRRKYVFKTRMTFINRQEKVCLLQTCEHI